MCIEWTAEKLKAFGKAYQEASKAGADSFKFEGNDYATRYAKYLIEYLLERFKV
jgi:hypothetical protein